MLYKVPFYISSAKSTLTAWSWNKPVILQILSFLEPVRYNTAFLSFSPHPSASSGKKKKKKILQHLQKQEDRLERKSPYTKGKVCISIGKQNQKLKTVTKLSYSIWYNTISQLSCHLKCNKQSKGKAVNLCERGD